MGNFWAGYLLGRWRVTHFVSGTEKTPPRLAKWLNWACVMKKYNASR